MTEFQTKVFDTQSLGRRLIRKKVWGKIPALPLVTLLVVASFAAAVFFALGPAVTQNVTLGKMTGAGLPSADVLYGQVGTGTNTYFNVTVASNSYAASHSAYVVIFVSTNGVNFPDVASCNAELLVKQTNNVTTVYNTITATYTAGCVFTGVTTQTVNAGKIGANAPNWPTLIQYVSSPAGRGPLYTWTVTFYGT